MSRTVGGRLAEVLNSANRLRTVAARIRGLPPPDALLLLPSMPSTAAVPRADRGWTAALAHWGIVVDPSSAEFVVGATSHALSAAVRPAQVLVPGADRFGRLRRAGYSVTTYRVRWLNWDIVAAASNRRAFRTALRTWAPGRRRARGVRGLLLPILPCRRVSVAAWALDSERPAVVAAERPARDSANLTCLAVDVRDDRRRAVFLALDGDGDARAVIKISRSPGGDDRASHEQRILSLLPPTGVTPRPLGTGRIGPLAWSAETVLSGQPLRQMVSCPVNQAYAVLEQLGDWLSDVALRSAVAVDWRTAGSDDATVALRGRAAGLWPVLRGLRGVPGVLSHGDLASGYNVLVDRSGRPGVLDWETARQRGLPLLDLLPLLCWSLARCRGEQGPQREAAFILKLALGRSSDSDWLYAQVARYASRLALSPDTVGPLALLAWGHQASMRLVRDEMLCVAGLPVRQWTSAAELVLDAWWNEIGTAWPGPMGHLS